MAPAPAPAGGWAWTAAPWGMPGGPGGWPWTAAPWGGKPAGPGTVADALIKVRRPANVREGGGARRREVAEQERHLLGAVVGVGLAQGVRVDAQPRHVLLAPAAVLPA